ncbi:MAG TPA: DUF3060 domain-containing protein [Kofleriaceae bacterium]|nr:DUF3060 domain-containing protein [Kofleriaceae bacterium]
MKLVATLLAASLALVPAAAIADRSFNAETAGSHDCAKDPIVSINSSGGTFTLTGTCDLVSVNGADNKVTVEGAKKVSVNGSTNAVDIGAADRISVNGSDNKVTYKKSLAGGKPKVSSLGTGNKVTLVK